MSAITEIELRTLLSEMKKADEEKQETRMSEIADSPAQKRLIELKVLDEKGYFLENELAYRASEMYEQMI